MAILEVIDVSFRYPDGFSAIEDLSFSLDKGESVAVVGQNGAGKTTTMKLINGLLKPTSGKIIVDGWNVKDYTTPELSKKVGYVFQNPDDQIFHDTVYQEIKFGPENLNLTKKEIENNITYAANLLEIDKYLYDDPLNLPYSLKKFVTIASIIAMNSEIIILDEPTAGQDDFSNKILSKAISELKLAGKTIITITHDMEFVANNFERVIVMANKRKIMDSNKHDVFTNDKVLTAASLRKPYIEDLREKLNIEKNLLTLDEMLDYFKLISS